MTEWQEEIERKIANNLLLVSPAWENQRVLLKESLRELIEEEIKHFADIIPISVGPHPLTSIQCNIITNQVKELLKERGVK